MRPEPLRSATRVVLANTPQGRSPGLSAPTGMTPGVHVMGRPDSFVAYDCGAVQVASCTRRR